MVGFGGVFDNPIVFASKPTLKAGRSAGTQGIAFCWYYADCDS